MTRPRHSMPRCLALAGLLAALASAPAPAAESVGVPAAPAPAASSLPVDPRAAVDATASAVLTPDSGSTAGAGPKPSSPATATTADSSAAPRRASAAPTDAQAAMPRPAIKRQRIATAQPVRRSAYRVAGCAPHGCDRHFVLMIGIGY